MKLLINTQHRENYAAHNEDFVPGVSQDYWKFKGGSTFVVENLSSDSVAKIEAEGIPTLTALIEDRNSSFEEYILGYDIVEDGAAVCEEWETPMVLDYDADIKEWRSTKLTINGDMGYMRSDIASKAESWIMRPKNEREDYRVMYVLKNGARCVGNDALSKALKQLELETA
jgi:hypothetical protein